MIVSMTYAAETTLRKASITRLGPRSWLVTISGDGPGSSAKRRSLARAQADCRAWVGGSRDRELRPSENNC